MKNRDKSYPMCKSMLETIYVPNYKLIQTFLSDWITNTQREIQISKSPVFYSHEKFRMPASLMDAFKEQLITAELLKY